MIEASITEAVMRPRCGAAAAGAPSVAGALT
jgi:hypothetical protein